MAEYIEVMKQFDRMCWYYQRKRECPMACPMNGVNISQCRKVAFEEPETTEKIVMAWAAQHPEPQYPTWAEWLLKVGAARRVPIGEPWPTELPDGSMLEPCYEIVVKENERIPAYIAEPLGIEPKEDNK